VAGMLLGIFQNLAVAYLPSALTETIIYGLLFVVLLALALYVPAPFRPASQ